MVLPSPHEKLAESGRFRPVSARLSDLATIAGAHPSEVLLGNDPETLSISADSRKVQPGDLFVCMPSTSRDTHDFISVAKEQGASAVVVHSPDGLNRAKESGLPSIYLEHRGSHFNFVLGRICSHILGNPSQSMGIIGVTGTNGKTTTAWMISHALAHLGRKPAYLGTLGFKFGEALTEMANTTPYPVELWHQIKAAQDQGATEFVLECSSHALYERRLSGLHFDVGLFTNLSQDHLDFHVGMREYIAAKKLFFTEYAAASNKPFVTVLNEADKIGAKWASELPTRVKTFGGRKSDLVLSHVKIELHSISFVATTQESSAEANLKFGGDFNLENASAAIAGLLAYGVSLSDAVEALGKVDPVPGRFESVPNEADLGIIIDYAHTPDAVAKLLESIRAHKNGRIITVFGCGGDRDRSKRPKMAEAVSRLSDVTIATSDNPRTEDPESILRDVAAGLHPEAVSEVILDRRKAVARAIELAQAGDVLVIAGKGHETYQIIGRTKYPLDDRDLIREALRR